MRQRMKKTAFMAAALTGAALLSAEARNVVGYVKVEVPAGYSLVSVPFEKVGGGKWTLGEVFTNAPEDTQVFLFSPNSGMYSRYTKLDTGEWVDEGGQDASATLLERSVGFWVENPRSQPFDLIFHGLVPTSPVNKSLTVGFQIVAYGFPSEADLATSGPMSPSDDDKVFEFNPITKQYSRFTYVEDIGWLDESGNPVQFNFLPGRAYWYQAWNSIQWQQTPNYSL